MNRDLILQKAVMKEERIWYNMQVNRIFNIM